jgi:signal peptidase II
MRYSQIIKYLGFIIGLLLLDQGSKYLITSNMSLSETIPVINNFFHITYVENPGAAFGMLAYKTPLFIGLTFVVVIAMFYYLSKLEFNSVFNKITIGMLIAGAIGNLIDRLRTGMVIDFLDFRGIWPFVFNVADILICVGVALLLFEVIKSAKDENNKDNLELDK